MLAAADIQQVNVVWAGLGYYKRARYLLDGAQYVAAHLGGQLPRTKEELQRIPGDHLSLLGGTSPTTCCVYKCGKHLSGCTAAG